MAERAGLGAQTFLLPQPAPQQAEQVQQPYNDGVQALEGLQYVKGQTSDYYKKVADLKSYMQSVQQNLGIDVRVPDLSRPESIKLNQVYRDAIADIQAHGNELKQGASINNMLVSRGDIQTSTYGDQSAARAQYGKDFFNRNLEPSIMELNNKLQMPSYTREEYQQKETARQEAIKYWTEQAKDPSKKEYAEYQLRGISPTTQGQWRPQADTSYDRKQTANDNAMDVAFRKMVNFTQGTTPEWKSSTKPIEGKPGRFYMQNNEYAGFKLGDNPSPIKTAFLDRESGKGYFVFQDGKTEEFTGTDPVPTLQKLADTNPRFGFTGSQMYDYAQRKGIYTGTGAVNTAGFIDTPENQQKEIARMQQEESQINKIQTALGAKIRSKTAGQKWWLLKPNDRVTLPVKFGGTNEIKLEARGNGTFNVENFSDVFKPFYTGSDNKVNTTMKSELENYFNSEQPIEVIIQKLLPMLNKAQYPALLKAFNITQEELDQITAPEGGDSSPDLTTPGTNSANNDPLGILQ